MAGCPQVSDDSASSGISSGAETELYTEESDEEGGVLLVPKMISTSHHSNDRGRTFYNCTYCHLTLYSLHRSRIISWEVIPMWDLSRLVSVRW